MRLHELLRQTRPTIDVASVPDTEITGIEDDSRRVKPGQLFVARPGTKNDGAAFAEDAIARGAAVILTQSMLNDIAVPQLVVPTVGELVSPLANAFQGWPAKDVRVLGVTGTNGKTTTTYLIRHILNTVGQTCGMIGTVEIDDGHSVTEAAMTTPSAVDVAALLATMRGNACRACAIEVSSHALHQGRTSGVAFAGAGFTNLTGDHLDYHGTMDAYADAKATLFATLPADAVAAVNADSPHADRMIRDTAARVVRFGIDAAADYRASESSVTAEGTSFVLTTRGGQTQINTRLVGRHNIENALCALTLCCEVFGLSVSAAADALKTAAGAPGRLQPVPGDKPFAVLVDYAHTDDALRNVLTALRPLTGSRLKVVFGCGGDRDRTKRPRMARVAEQFADDIYVTSDNPRTEDAEAILNDIVAGFSLSAKGRIHVDADRRGAIERAIGDAKAGDVVLIAGKGHENYQIIGTTKQHFDDVEEAARALTAVAS